MRVLVNCCGQEKYYNRFYALLGQKLCEYKDDHKYTLKYTLWDQIKNLHRFTLRKVNNIAKFTAEMIFAFSQPLSVLKILEFQQLSKNQIILLNIVIEELLTR